jgi:hypothetical protein
MFFVVLLPGWLLQPKVENTRGALRISDLQDAQLICEVCYRYR